MPCGRHIDVVVSTAVSHQGGPKFESTSQRRPFCVEFGCSPYAYMGPKSMETSYEIYPLVQKPLTVTLQILWNVSEMRGVCGCPSRSLSKRKLKGRSLNLEAAVHSFWQFAPERQLKCSQFVVHVKKNQHDTLLQWSKLSLDFSPTSVSFHESNTMNVFQQQLSESVSKRHKRQQDTDFKERRDACMTTRPFLNHTLISKGDLLCFYFLSYCYNDGCSY